MNIENIDIPEIHIGNMILDYMKQHRISQAELARNIKLDTSNLNKLLKKKSMETDRLMDICIALEHNFFPLFCNDTKAYNSVTSYGPIDLGVHIEMRMKEIGMTQVEFASKLGVSQSEISRILNKDSFETDKLTIISRILGYNFFQDFYHITPTTQQVDNIMGAELLIRYEELIIENERLRNEIAQLRKEIQELKGTIK